jgi:hypothetical protein
MYKRHSVENIEPNFEHRFLDFQPIGSTTPIRVAFYDVNRILLFGEHISVYYKKKSVATMKGDSHLIRLKGRELRMTQLHIVDKS